jgi:hypothetical protein
LASLSAEIIARAALRELLHIRIPGEIGAKARREHRIAQRDIATRAARRQRHAKIGIEDRGGGMHADAGRDQHPRRGSIGAGRIAHRRKARPIVLQDRAPIGKKPTPLPPFQIGEPYRLHPWLRAQLLLQAQSLHALRSWRMRSLRLPESSP